MASSELDGLDAPACPLLGLARDRRSHFTYPNPDHRCFAKKHPSTTDAARQGTYCLSGQYRACDRYQARSSTALAGRGPVPASGEGYSSTGGAPLATTTPQPTVVHALRAGDSLARIAKAYGLTVEQIARANGITPNQVLAEGTRLVIPIGPAAASGQARDPSPGTSRG
jgi:hypothetical protein